MSHRVLLVSIASLLALMAAPLAGASAAVSPALEATAAGSYPFGKDRAVLKDGAWKLEGVARTGEGGKVVVRVYRGKRSALTRRPVVGADGRFQLSLRIKRAGELTIVVVRPVPKGETAPRVRLGVSVLDPGDRSGASMRFLQERLEAMGYWPGRSGGYDLRTRWAIMAYRKVNRMARNFEINRSVFERVARGAGRFVPRFGATGRNRVEAQISRQVYSLIDAKGRVYRTVPTSSGKPGFRSDLGRFRFYRKQPGVNSLGMVNSTYYNGGEALHGYPDVPTYPASHGCLRTPTTYSRQIMDWIRFGDRIDVYR